MNGMILAEGVKLQPLPEPRTMTLYDSLQHHAPFILLSAVLLGVALLLGRRTEKGRLGDAAAGMAKASRIMATFLLILTLTAMLLTPFLKNWDERAKASSLSVRAMAANVTAVKEHYRLDGLTGWKGLPVEGGHRVVWLRRDAGTERSGTGTVWVHDGTATLYDGDTGKELGWTE